MKITIRAGRPTEIMRPDRRADIEELAKEFAKVGDVDIQITDYVPGRRGLSWPEAVGIYLAGQISASVVPTVLEDIYAGAKKWARKRFERKAKDSLDGNPRPETFTIYGPDGEVLRTWTIHRDGESESGSGY